MGKFVYGLYGIQGRVYREGAGKAYEIGPSLGTALYSILPILNRNIIILPTYEMPPAGRVLQGRERGRRR